MRLGTNYPIGPIAWGREIGGRRVARILQRLARVEGREFAPHRSLWVLDLERRGCRRAQRRPPMPARIVRCGSSKRCARRSGATGARWRAFAPTIWRRSSCARAIDRTGVPPERIDDVYFGAANGSGEDNRNVARMAVLLAGLPVEVPGVDGQPAVRIELAGDQFRRAGDRFRRVPTSSSPAASSR